ncbi:CesT family type III secretion system chaperone [Thalassomonas actiniarum]|uniref:Type III secretion system chaperone n=1 Tax=Thalassomonas actiniarum TaxID=485447 RepID=A0AAE9YXX9_9GAMM|nr:CesT family type III secretion system chaperone [Thalassomonas actiniarum]WDE02602.1 type III secretion system chaperone [Thalassomonas actiniarum]
MENNVEQLSHWLKDLGDFQLNDEGNCFMVSENNVEVAILGPENADRFYINCFLIELNDAQRDAVFELALSLNSYQEKTRGATIALDQVNNRLNLCYRLEYQHCNYQEFVNILSNLIELTKKFQVQFIELGQNSTAPAMQSAPEDALMMRV